MKHSHASRLLSALAIALLVLLPLLAVLQYRWLDQLSRGEAIRMRENLLTLVGHFQGHIDREIDRAYQTFMALQADAPDEAAGELVRRHTQWVNTAPFPDLIEEVYWVERTASGDPTLYRLDITENKLSSVPWPEHLKDWMSFFGPPIRFEQIVSRPDRKQQIVVKSFRKKGTDTASSLSPGMSIPVLPLSPPGSANPRDVLLIQPDTNFILLSFDREVLTDVVLPELVQNYFGSRGDLDYDVLIVDEKNEDEIWYRSRPELTLSKFSNPDISANVGPPDWRLSGPLSFPPIGRTPTHLFRVAEGDLAVHLTVTKPRVDSVRVLFDEVVTIQDSFQENVSTDSTLIRGIGTEWSHTWRLYARHKTGSLEAAVTIARWRNVGISFGILLILGLTTLLILGVSRRMQHLAEQQMSFVAGVSHELRTPIAVMHSAGENLKDGLITEGEETRRYGSLIVDESRKLLDMVEQVMAYAGISSGRRTSTAEPILVSELIDLALGKLKPILEEGGFVLEKQIGANLPILHGDPEALLSAIHNLLQNAIKYCGHERWIGLSATLEHSSSQSEVVIQVKDRGIGITERDLPHIFEPFFRGPEALASRIRGSGLGLTLVKQIVTAHGGRIGVESDPGQGSVFTIYLPAKESEPVPDNPLTPKPSGIPI